MKNVSSALEDFLESIILGTAVNRSFAVADLFTFTLVSGTILRYTSWDSNITIGANTWTALGPLLQRSKTKSSIGLSVDSVEIRLLAGGADHVNGMPILEALRLGRFDGADCRIERYFIPRTSGDSGSLFDYTAAATMGTLILWRGTFSEIRELGRTHCVFAVRSKLELLSVQLPRNLIQPACRHVLFDAGCTLDPAAFQKSGVVGSGPTIKGIRATITGFTPPDSIAAPASAPTLSDTDLGGGVNLQQAIYWAGVTYTTALGETLMSPLAYHTVPDNHVLTVHVPSTATGAIGWNVYAGKQPQDVQKQNAVALPFSGSPLVSSFWQGAFDGLVQGTPPPMAATDGYFSQGTITFTSGVLNGLTYFIDSYGNGILLVLPAFLAIPSPGDTFTILPGCDLQASTCKNKFNNLIHIGSMPWCPQPEAGI